MPSLVTRLTPGQAMSATLGSLLMIGAIAVPLAAQLKGSPTVLGTTLGVGVLGALTQRLAWRFRRDGDDRIFYVSSSERVLYYLSNIIFFTFLTFAFFAVFGLIAGIMD
ncbi:hypothetical protein [Alloactinosynnema sp. L-07]|nr:hypothetical protein [Alloactinosynnema sp. L-07]